MSRRRAVLLAWGALAAVFLIRGAAEPKNDFRFSIMGDRTGGHQDQVFGRVWREVDLLHPDFVINVGDTIEGSRNHQTMAGEWQGLRPVWERYKHYPLYFTPGTTTSGPTRARPSTGRRPAAPPTTASTTRTPTSRCSITPAPPT